MKSSAKASIPEFRSVRVHFRVFRRAREICLLVAVTTFGGELAGQERPVDFNREIRPILAENCFFCHGQDAGQRQADLRLDEPESALGSGVLVPGDAASSPLMMRVLADDPDLLMPPPDSQRRLTAEQKAVLGRWIGEGAVYAGHWAFQPPRRPPVPEPEGAEWCRNPVDRFVLATLRTTPLVPSPEADRATLIRRLSADLTGLPPTPAEVAAFVADPDPEAYEKLVDRLMADPHYGERMALPWLDAARYADSNGFQQDGDTWQWIWRDWVVEAINRDLPFDRFSVWQLAGDLLPDATTEQKIASAFNRNHLLNGEGGAIPEEQRFVGLFDRMDTTATNWLGLTMACAQCHDHKYDPVTQRDYYSLMDAFNRVPEKGTPGFQGTRIRLDTPWLELPNGENAKAIGELEKRIEAADLAARPLLDAAFAGWKLEFLSRPDPATDERMPKSVRSLLEKAEAERNDEEKKQLLAGLRKYFDETIAGQLAGEIPAAAAAAGLRQELADYRKNELPRLMIMSDDEPRTTHILQRGAYLSPGEAVRFAVPGFLPPIDPSLPANRLGFAEWLFSADHPLTARVQVNRLWQHFFGQGLVRTAEDFGVQGDHPLHAELLDWLALEFRDRGWSMKAINRLLVTSATYRQSSRVRPEHLQWDAENRYLARSSRLRLPSMILRDWALAASGLLDPAIGGAPVYPYQPDAVWESLAITKERDFTYPTSTGPALYRRSLYTFWRRTVAPANLFDAANRQSCRVRQSPTNSPLHALTMLNDPTWVEASRVLAGRAMQSGGSLVSQLEEVFAGVLCRPPRAEETELLSRTWLRQLAHYRSDPESGEKLLAVGASPRDRSLDPAEHAALTCVCLALFNLDEAIMRE